MRMEADVLAKFISNAEACKSTKDIVVRELVYAFNRYCENNRFPVLQCLEINSPGYVVQDGKVHDATDGQSLIPHVIYPTQSRAKKKRPERSTQPGAA